jgi:hypothetical protein
VGSRLPQSAGEVFAGVKTMHRRRIHRRIA